MKRNASIVRHVIDKYGHCLELVSMDPHFHSVSVGLFFKEHRYAGTIFTVWSYAKIEGIEDRLRVIRDKLVDSGEMMPVTATFPGMELNSNQVVYRHGSIIEKPLRFIFVKAVETHPDTPAPVGDITVTDSKSNLIFKVSGGWEEYSYIYKVTASGEAANPESRIRAVVGGYMKYGECKRLSSNSFKFPDDQPHDGFARVLLNYAKNVSASENILASQEQQGQMNTQTLGFSQT